MLTWLKDWLKTRSQRKALEEFKARWQFELHDGYLAIGANRAGVVSEYGPLLRYLTNGKLDSFENFEAIADNAAAIDAAITLDLSRPMPREVEALGVAQETARSTLERLRVIVRCLNEYVQLARSIGLPPNPMLSNDPA